MDIELTAADGHRFAAWLTQPAGRPRGALVVVQEIFGVNGHIRSVADGWAADGYVAIAPALFDRVERGVELGYGEADIARGFALKNACGSDRPLADLAAALAHVGYAGKVGVLGFCWGGLLAWLAACTQDGWAASVPYYGGGIPQHAGLVPRCPVLAHFGALDQHIPLPSVQAWQARQPSVEVHVYDGAGHGFNCGQRASHHPASAQLARARSLAFLRRHVG